MVPLTCPFSPQMEHTIVYILHGSTGAVGGVTAKVLRLDYLRSLKRCDHVCEVHECNHGKSHHPNMIYLFLTCTVCKGGATKYLKVFVLFAVCFSQSNFNTPVMQRTRRVCIIKQRGCPQTFSLAACSAGRRAGWTALSSFLQLQEQINRRVGERLTRPDRMYSY